MQSVNRLHNWNRAVSLPGLTLQSDYFPGLWQYPVCSQDRFQGARIDLGTESPRILGSNRLQIVHRMDMTNCTPYLTLSNCQMPVTSELSKTFSYSFICHRINYVFRYYRGLNPWNSQSLHEFLEVQSKAKTEILWLDHRLQWEKAHPITGCLSSLSDKLQMKKDEIPLVIWKTEK